MGRGVAGVLADEYKGDQIYFEDLTPFLTYGWHNAALFYMFI
jgi:hypothetical protein